MPLRAWPFDSALDVSRNRGWFHRLCIWMSNRPRRERRPW